MTRPSDKTSMDVNLLLNGVCDVNGAPLLKWAVYKARRLYLEIREASDPECLRPWETKRLCFRRASRRSVVQMQGHSTPTVVKFVPHNRRRICYTTHISPAGWTRPLFRRALFYMATTLTNYPPYPNQPMTDPDLVQLMLARGLAGDVAELSSAVTSVGYYRLKGYLVPFLKPGTENFKDGADFATVWRVYTFDRRLRQLVMDALSRIEVALRAMIVREHLVVNADPFGYVDPASLPSLRHAKHTSMLAKIADATRNAKNEPFIAHLATTYGITQYPPLWIMMQIVPFGTLLYYFQGLPAAVQQQIANSFHVRPSIFLNWLTALKKGRNVCAHHARLWNRHIDSRLSRRIGAASELVSLDQAFSFQPTDAYTTVYSLLSLCAYCLSVVRPQSKWRERCRALLESADQFVLNGMGVPAGWQKLALWQ